VDTSLSGVAAAVRSSVVQVLPGDSGGAGVALLRGGEMVVITNAHVARGSVGERIRVLSDRRRVYPATIEHADARRDLALLTLGPRPPGGAGDLSAATLAEATTLRPGQLVLAVGHPFGLTNAVTAGVIHAVGPLRSGWEPPFGSRGLSYVQADVMLAPGNSGGPLVDMEGRVIGINTMVFGGLALAVPVPDIRALLVARGEAIPA
jgi:serine protease Do